MRSRGWGACYASWVGCMLYHAGLPRSPAYESHPWMKGWLNVVVDKLICNMSCVHVTFQAQVGAFDGELLMAIAMLAYACVLVGLSVGYADRATIPPTQFFEQHEVETNRRRTPTIRHLQPRSPVYVPVDTRRPPPRLSRGHHDPRPPAHWHSRASGSVPGSPRDSRTSAWPPRDTPPGPRPRAPLRALRRCNAGGPR